MKFSTVIPSLFAILISTQDVHARFGGQGGRGGGRGGGDRPFGGGLFGDRPGFPGAQIRPNVTSIDCDASFACETRRGGQQGTFVCRETYNPISGDVRQEAKCVPNDRAWETDTCGCCDGDCPEQPDFVPSTCPTISDSNVQISRQFNRPGGKNGGGGLDNRVLVCREVYDPFTGDLTSVTLPIRTDRGLEGDTCGCCDEVCPQPGDKIFTRPDQVELDWCEADTITSCTVPRRKGKGDQEDSSENDGDRQGVFVCRSMANMLTGVAESQPICIPTDRAWETDQCGCCGLDCPAQPERTDIECTAQADQCQRRNGEDGVFVCRSMFHPLDGSVVDVPLCIPSENSWATDQCGCCDGNCPTAPQAGFENEDTQIMMLALEEPQSGNDASGAFTSSSILAVGVAAIAVLASL